MTEDDARLRDEDVADAVGVDVDSVARWRELGLVSNSEGSAGWETVRTASAAGLPDGALLKLLRVYADSLGRVADAVARRGELLLKGLDEPIELYAATAT